MIPNAHPDSPTPTVENAEEQHRRKIAELEAAIHHETTQHARRLREEKKKAPPLDPHSQQRQFR